MKTTTEFVNIADIIDEDECGIALKVQLEQFCELINEALNKKVIGISEANRYINSCREMKVPIDVLCVNRKIKNLITPVKGNKGLSLFY